MLFRLRIDTLSRGKQIKAILDSPNNDNDLKQNNKKKENENASRRYMPKKE